MQTRKENGTKETGRMKLTYDTDAAPLSFSIISISDSFGCENEASCLLRRIRRTESLKLLMAATANMKKIFMTVVSVVSGVQPNIFLFYIAFCLLAGISSVSAFILTLPPSATPSLWSMVPAKPIILPVFSFWSSTGGVNWRGGGGSFEKGSRN